jgi:hypothetical protein
MTVVRGKAASRCVSRRGAKFARHATFLQLQAVLRRPSAPATVHQNPICERSRCARRASERRGFRVFGGVDSEFGPKESCYAVASKAGTVLAQGWADDGGWALELVPIGDRRLVAARSRTAAKLRVDSTQCFKENLENSMPHARLDAREVPLGSATERGTARQMVAPTPTFQATAYAARSAQKRRRHLPETPAKSALTNAKRTSNGAPLAPRVDE